MRPLLPEVICAHAIMYGENELKEFGEANCLIV